MRLRLSFLFSIVVLCSAATVAQGGWLELVGTPTQVVENGQVGWEYWYDVYVDVGGIAPTQLVLGGFDATQTLNLNGGSLYQRWDSAAAGYDGIWGQLDDYPSYRVDKNGPDVWTLNTTDWAMDNPIHSPNEYSGVSANSMYAGSSSVDGIHFWQAIGQGYRSGLFMTIRLVHPLGPGQINYSICGWVWEQSETPIIGPAVAGGPAGDFDGDLDVDADDIDILCANMGGDVATYDMDGDLDVDEDDLIYHVENLVELQDGSGRVGTKRGDFNLDGFVNATDLAIMKPNFGLSGMLYSDGNANCDVVINGTDLAVLSGNIGFAAPTGAIPEPLTIGLLSIGGVALLRRRSR